METIKTYMIHWFGPFEGNKEKVALWESEHPEYICNLYLLKGLRIGAKYKPSYYCGKTVQGVAKRLSNAKHSINKYRKVEEIWIGCFRNIEADSSDIFDTENIITAYLADEVGFSQMLNKINMCFPSHQVCVINRWYKPDCTTWKRLNFDSPAKIVPEVLLHYYDSGDHLIDGSEKLRTLKVVVR